MTMLLFAGGSLCRPPTVCTCWSGWCEYYCLRSATSSRWTSMGKRTFGSLLNYEWIVNAAHVHLLFSPADPASNITKVGIYSCEAL